MQGIVKRHFTAAITPALLLAGILFSAPAIADPVELSVPADEAWQHQWTEMEFPVSIGEFNRNRIIQFEEREGNISANYYGDDSRTVLSIYIFRPGVPDPSIWHDRAVTAISTNQMLGSVNLNDRETHTFVPSGATTASGIMTVFKAGGDFKSTAVALYRSEDWLVKVRMSSERLSRKKLTELLEVTLQSFSPLNDKKALEAYRIESCSDDIVFSLAERVSPEDFEPMAIAIASGIMATGAELDTDPDEKPVRYCGQGPRSPRAAIYRPIGTNDQYLIAFGDAGFSVNVAPSSVLTNIASELKDASDTPKLYEVSTADAALRKQFLPFTGLPSVNQAATTAFEERPVSSVKRPFGDEGTTITIFTDDETEEAVTD